MDIIIDVRALMGGKTSGVEVYTRNLLRSLFQLDKENRYILYANAYSDQRQFLQGFERENVTLVCTRIPNKLMNLLLWLIKYPKIDKLAVKNQRKFRDFKPAFLFLPDLRPCAASAGIKKVLVVHDLSWIHFPHFYSLRSRLWHRMLNFRKALINAEKIIAVSKFTADDIISCFGISRNKITVIYEGVGDFTADPHGNSSSLIKKKYSLPEKYFLFLATLEPRKNLPRLIEALRLFKQKDGSNIKLVLAGVKNEKIFHKTQPLDFKDVVTCGFVAEEDKPLLFKQAAAFIYPSLFEGFGLPLLEAMSCATPIITSNVSSMPEIVKDAALLIDPENAKDIAEAMAKVLEPENAKLLKERMLKRIKDFSWEKCARQTLEIFESI